MIRSRSTAALLEAHFLKGVWDGTVDLVKGVYGLAVFAAKINPTTNPLGFWKEDLKFIQGAAQFARAFWDNPGEVTRTIAKGVLNLDDLRNDPAHWVGALIPSIALAIATDGAGVAARAATASSKAELIAKGATGLRSETAAFLERRVSLRDLEHKQGINGWDAHTATKHVTPSGKSSIDVMKEWLHDPSRTRRKEGLFFSQSIADRTVTDALRTNAQEISNWLRRPDTEPLDFKYIAPDKVGLTAMKRHPEDIFTSKEIKVVLRRSTTEPQGFIVETAFPWYTSVTREPYQAFTTPNGGAFIAGEVLQRIGDQ